MTRRAVDTTVFSTDKLQDAGSLHNRVALGTFLRRARENRGLTLDQISKETRIPRYQLDALERGDLAAIPGAFYRRAHIRAYAHIVRLDQGPAREWLEHSIEALRADDAAPQIAPAEHLPRLRPRLVGVSAGVCFALLLVVTPWNRGPLREELAQDRAESEATRLNAQPALPILSDTSISAERSETTARVEQDPLPLEGTLVITTQPAGARVTVDGIGWGHTPITIRYLPTGTKRIRATKDGYASQERVVHLTAARPTTTVSMPLRIAP